MKEHCYEPIVKVEYGWRIDYNPCRHYNTLYITIDTKELLFNGVSYNRFNIQDINYQNGTIYINVGNRLLSCKLPNASKECAGLMSPLDKQQLDYIFQLLQDGVDSINISENTSWGVGLFKNIDKQIQPIVSPVTTLEELKNLPEDTEKLVSAQLLKRLIELNGLIYEVDDTPLTYTVSITIGENTYRGSVEEGNSISFDIAIPEGHELRNLPEGFTYDNGTLTISNVTSNIEKTLTLSPIIILSSIEVQGYGLNASEIYSGGTNKKSTTWNTGTVTAIYSDNTTATVTSSTIVSLSSSDNSVVSVNGTTINAVNPGSEIIITATYSYTKDGRTVTTEKTALITVTAKSISSIEWAPISTIPSGTVGTTPNLGNIKITYNNSDTENKAYNASGVTLWTNPGGTNSFNNLEAGTHNLYAKYDGKITTNSREVTLRQVVTYYWYVGQTNPSTMNSISGTADFNNGGGWTSTGNSVPETINQLVKGFDNTKEIFVAVPITSGTTLKPVASDMSTIDTSVHEVSTTTLNGVNYQIYTYDSGVTRTTVLFAKK